MKEEIKNRIVELGLEIAAEGRFFAGANIEKKKMELELLEKFYNAMYGW